MAIRNCYDQVKRALTDATVKKVIFVLHSQGGIEGGMVLDWLLADVPEITLRKLEIYTFGCAANHFNNPVRASDRQGVLESLWSGKRDEKNERVISHIEHYANSDDFVSKWGVLSFADSKSHKTNRFSGRLFKRDGSGHQFNQHYLDGMFPLLGPLGPVDEDNSFVNTLVKVQEDVAIDRESASAAALAAGTQSLKQGPLNNVKVNGGAPKTGPIKPLTNGNSTLSDSQILQNAAQKNAATTQTKPVRELSRLWQYRNGQSPKD